MLRQGKSFFDQNSEFNDQVLFETEMLLLYLCFIKST